MAGFVVAGTPAAPLAWPVAKYDVVWDSPSADSRGSMPLGNGDIGINASLESSGDLHLIVGKSDSFDEFNRLLKLGRIRVRTTPALIQPGQPFSQTLHLEDGSIEITTATAKLRVWVDANHPVVQVDCEAATPLEVRVIVQSWRKENRALGDEGPGANSAYGNWPDKMRVNADTILPSKPGQLAWCHHNVESQWKRNLELTGLGDEAAKSKDPVLDRSFGALVRADGLRATSNTELKSAKPASAFSLQIVPLTTFAPSAEAWLAQAEKTASAIPSSTADRFAAHVAWWHNFWNRNWIDISQPPSSPTDFLTFQGKLGLGVDSRGGSRFGGTIADPVAKAGVLSPEEIARVAKSPHGETAATGAPDIPLTGDFSVMAWIKPAKGEAGRIFDKCTVGKPDGLLFDTHPGESLRLAVGSTVMTKDHCLVPGTWQHVAATFEAKTGTQTLYLDGKPIGSKKGREESDSGVVSQAYALQRFVTACSSRGALPLKFNGSLFTVDGRDPDFRAWGGAYWWQNTRLPYWGMLYSGDYDLMQPLFKMYRDALPLRKAATKKYYGHDGAFYPETMYFWGNYTDENYGMNRKGKPDGLIDNKYIRYYWQGGIELVAMMLDYYDATQDTEFRDDTLLPMATEITTFFDQHWQRGADGKVFYSPAQSLETWHAATDPLPEVAGLRYLLPRLLALPADKATKTMWKKQLADQPAIPVVTKDGQTRLLPAKTYTDHSNVENPELYGVFPYQLYTGMQGGDALQAGINTWRARANTANIGWQQQPIQAALLGLANEAKNLVVQRAKAKASGYRFPGFYGPNYDWTPDQDQIAVFMVGLQRMLMQCEGDRIVLLPAWPKDWSASFKLHAPKNTVIEAQVENGELKNLKVTPESRRKDVEIRPAQ